MVGLPQLRLQPFIHALAILFVQKKKKLLEKRERINSRVRCTYIYGDTRVLGWARDGGGVWGEGAYGLYQNRCTVHARLTWQAAAVVDPEMY